MKRPLTPREWCFAAVACAMFLALLYVHSVNVELGRAVAFYRHMYSNTQIIISPKHETNSIATARSRALQHALRSPSTNR